jgi:hypothetical protein
MRKKKEKGYSCWFWLRNEGILYDIFGVVYSARYDLLISILAGSMDHACWSNIFCSLQQVQNHVFTQSPWSKIFFLLIALVKNTRCSCSYLVLSLVLFFRQTAALTHHLHCSIWLSLSIEWWCTVAGGPNRHRNRRRTWTNRSHISKGTDTQHCPWPLV